jgi:putative hydroxymethylpyrimidine transport system ATP-binding protein
MKQDIIIYNAHLNYPDLPMFANLELTLSAGCWTSIVGATGSGKSSLLKMLAGLLPKVCDFDFDCNVPKLAQQIAYMGQADFLFPWKTVRDNVLLANILAKQAISPAHQAKADALLERVGLAQVANAYPNALSGGMRQRVALARTLMQDKPIVFMDEPFSALDAVTKHQMQALAFDVLKNKTVLLITHDPMEALRLSSQLFLMLPKSNLEPLALPQTQALRAINDPNMPAFQQTIYQALQNASAYDF